MIVCSHGNVGDYCKEYDMIATETHTGEILDYDGICRVIVTDQEMTENEYYSLKGLMLSKGYELVSVHHTDKRCLVNLIIHMTAKDLEARKKKFAGRYMFGTNADGWIPGMRDVVMKIFDLKEVGFSLRQIKACPDVHHPDGRSVSISTIRNVLEKKEEYMKIEE